MKYKINYTRAPNIGKTSMITWRFKMYTAEYFIDKLKMESHVEGGYSKEVYKNAHTITDGSYKIEFEDERSLSSTIHFLLKSGQVSKFHKLKFDEIWFYHYGCPIIVHMIDERGIYTQMKLGLNIEAGENVQILIPANVIFGAEPMEKDSFSLVSCMVSPGFDYRDFILYEEEELISSYPKHAKIIHKLNGNKKSE
ncbi:MAG: cupin domain-containing protein [Candidatus Delongbacteria bacterium]|jgi:predicted cupin superfamily sugar epimerase|nr:cupin domain-containing protein [Candidatus Delongbacteria bacterium]